MSKELKNPEDAIGRKIRWHGWSARTTEYFIPEKIEGKYIYGELVMGRTSHRDRFHISKGIRTKMEKGEKKKLSYWYLIEDIHPIQLELFEI